MTSQWSWPLTSQCEYKIFPLRTYYTRLSNSSVILLLSYILYYYISLYEIFSNGQKKLLCDLWPFSTKIEFILESKWTFVPNLRKFPLCVLEISRSQEWDGPTCGRMEGRPRNLECFQSSVGSSRISILFCRDRWPRRESSVFLTAAFYGKMWVKERERGEALKCPFYICICARADRVTLSSSMD